MATNQDNNHIKSQDVWANLVIAMLSVNRYPLDKTWEIFEQLKANGLFEPQNYAKWSHEELFKKLIASNYNRGYMTGIFVERLSTISNLLDDIKTNEQILANGTKHDVSELLKRVKGVGPVVLNNLLLIRGQ